MFYNFTQPDTHTNLPGDNIDLRIHLEYILNNYGNYILLRRNYRIHCKCYTEQIYKDSRSDCPYCLGTGLVNRIERHLSRKTMTMGDRLMIDRLQDTPYSKTMVDAYKFYMFHYVNPSWQDIIYEVSWDEEDPYKPLALIAEYDIIGVIPMRSDRGRIEYWAVHVHSRPFGRQIREAVVRNLSPMDIDNTYPDAVAQYDVKWQT